MACWTLAAALVCQAPALAAADQAAEDQAAADRATVLYAGRASLPNAQAAATMWQERLLRDAGDFEAAWRLGRAGYWLGEHLPTESARLAAFETGMDAARKAIAAQPARPDGYFWLAANMGGMAELKGIRAGLKYRSPIRRNIEKVLALDPAFQKGSGDRALGRWYFKVPGLFGGSKRKSEEHLRRSLTYHPQSIASRLFLAELYEDMGRKADAIRMLHEIAALAIDPEWAPEDEVFKDKGRKLLARLTR